MKYDFIIIGGGMSGLVCAYILSKEGKKVIVLEKNSQLGGGLQIFSRDKIPGLSRISLVFANMFA